MKKCRMPDQTCRRPALVEKQDHYVTRDATSRWLRYLATQSRDPDWQRFLQQLQVHCCDHAPLREVAEKVLHLLGGPQ